MLKKMSIKKIIVSTSVLFAMLLIYILPGKNYDDLDDIKQELEYVDQTVLKSSIFLMDSNNKLGITDVVVSSEKRDIEKRARELIDILINGGAGESKIPSGFRSIIPSETKIISIKYDKNLIKINFSKELLDVSLELEEKMVEAIVYTLTSIDNVSNIIIYVEGDILTKLPKTKINLPSTLNREFGINKEYDIKNTSNINHVTIYYINKYNDTTYYVPVTKYTNDNREKINIIIDELSSSSTYNSSLMSYLNSNTKLLSVEKEKDILQLGFNSYIFNDIENKNILEEVKYTICLSVADNYDVNEVVFTVDNEEIYKSVLKSIE